MELKNLIILVTGGASGLGEAIALNFKEKESDVYICDLDEKKGLELEKSTNNKIKFIKCDVTKEEDVEEMINRIRKEKGRIDCLVNCAGIFKAGFIATDKKVHNTNDFKKILSINTFGTFNVSRYAAKLMIDNFNKDKECNGVIINISSITATDGGFASTAYSASKYAIDSMTLPMARDLGKYKIRVVTLSPSATITPLTKAINVDNKLMDYFIAINPLKRLGLPEDITLATEFAIRNNYLNGTVIRIDGGKRVPHF